MIEDDMTGELDSTVIQLVGGEIMNQLNFHITISGSGSSMPTGALYTSQGALIKITRTTQNRIKFADALNMYVAHTHGPNSFWIIGRRAFAELPQFELSTGSGATFIQTLNQDPNNARLLGYPIVISDFLNALGSEGDFGLINPDHYAAAVRKQLTVESSIHYAFVNDITTWRLLARGAGTPIPTAPYAYRSVTSTNVDEHSPFVVLDDVYV
jgi:HK97 family phage major capsid protein